MGLLNLALGQLLGIFLPLAGLLVALYFYDRSRKRVLVSTLRFWPQRPAPAVRQRHKRIQHPLSLLLQLAALLLLLLAIADPRPGANGAAASQRVIVLDTSAAMLLPGAAGEQLMREAQALALAYVDSVPGADRLLLIEADGAPAVRVPFTADRERLREAIAAARPSWTALDLGAAFELAAGTLRLALDADSADLADRSDAGEVVYIGPGRFRGQPARPHALPRVRYLQTGLPGDAVGLTSLRARADHAEPGAWDVVLAVRNYGDQSASFRLDFLFEGSPLGHRELAVPPDEEKELRFTLRTKRSGRLLARAVREDSFPDNNEAAVTIPTVRSTRLEVVGGSESALEPLLSAGVRVEPKFVAAASELSEGAIHVWAGGCDPSVSRRAICFAPPGSPWPPGDDGTARDLPIRQWSVSHPLSRGVSDRDLTPSRARVFEVLGGDEIVASTSAGPVILARDTEGSKLVAFGFDLAGESVRGRLAAPLLFANAVDWLDSRAFRAATVEARSPGAIEISAPTSSREQVSVRTAEGDAIPWVLSDGKVKFFAGRKGTYRVSTADDEVTLFLTQPRIGTADWEPPAGVARDLPARLASASSWLPWPWLALLAAVLLLYDWIRFGRGRRLAAGALQDAAASAEGGRP